MRENPSLPASSSSLAPAAAVLPGEWFTAEEVRRHFERLELGGECRIQGLRAIAALGAAVKRAAFAKAPLPAAMIALFAVAYSFLPITNALRDLARFCQDIEGYHWGPTNVRISVFSDMLARLRHAAQRNGRRAIAEQHRQELLRTILLLIRLHPALSTATAPPRTAKPATTPKPPGTR